MGGRRGRAEAGGQVDRGTGGRTGGLEAGGAWGREGLSEVKVAEGGAAGGVDWAPPCGRTVVRGDRGLCGTRDAGGAFPVTTCSLQCARACGLGGPVGEGLHRGSPAPHARRLMGSRLHALEADAHGPSGSPRTLGTDAQAPPHLQPPWLSAGGAAQRPGVGWARWRTLGPSPAGAEVEASPRCPPPHPACGRPAA